jgi:uncharacterized damage-inducible protein DinB
MANDLLVSLFEHKRWASERFFAALRTVDAEANAGRMKLVLLTLDHAARVDRVFRDRIAGEPSSLATVVADEPPSLADLAGSVRAVDDWYVDYVAQASEPELGEVVEFSFVDDGSPGRMTRGEMLAHVLTHSLSHRTLMARHVEAMSAQLPSDMFTSFLHSEGRW